MNWKLYNVLVLPALTLIIILSFTLPLKYFFIVGIIPVILWTLYYSINFFQKRKAKNNDQNSDS
jgi:ABC-type dipeptide/oligopeptide/nickel transport system permease subunit